MHGLGDTSLSKASAWAGPGRVGPLILCVFFNKPRKNSLRSLMKIPKLAAVALARGKIFGPRLQSLATGKFCTVYARIRLWVKYASGSGHGKIFGLQQL